MPKNLLNGLILVLGLTCTGLLVWMWRQDRLAAAAQAERRARSPVAAALPPADPKSVAPQVDRETADLLAQLRGLLSRADSRAREALLSFKDEAALRRFLARAQKAGLTVVGQLGGLNSVRVRYDHYAALQAELQQNAGDYAAVGANYLISVPHAPAKEDRAAVEQVPFGNRTLSYLGADDPNRANWGRGTTIAILDTGVAPDATFGQGRLRTLDIGFGTAPGNGPEDGHGTGVAALAAGLSPDAAGVAPAANLLSIRVTDASGTSDVFTVAQAIVAATDAGAKIINVSLGGYATNATMSAAIGYALERGAVIVAAAGNDQAAQLAWPAADSRVISVGAIDAADQQVSFSNSGEQLQLTAPGYGVQTAWLNGQRAYVDGTSASAPLVAGAIAAVISQNPNLTAAQAAQVLVRTANDAGAPGADSTYGNGILNLGWAMNANTPGYVDTAVSGHYYDAASRELAVTVQNRSTQAVSGLTLNVTSGTLSTQYSINALAAGASQVVRVPVDTALLKSAGQVSYSTQLTNPAGLADRVPANNRKASVLSGSGGP